MVFCTRVEVCENAAGVGVDDCMLSANRSRGFIDFQGGEACNGNLELVALALDREGLAAGEFSIGKAGAVQCGGVPAVVGLCQSGRGGQKGEHCDGGGEAWTGHGDLGASVRARLAAKGREGVAAGFGGVGGVDVVQAAESAAVGHQDYEGQERPEGDQNVWLIHVFLVDEKPAENNK